MTDGVVKKNNELWKNDLDRSENVQNYHFLETKVKKEQLKIAKNLLPF